MNDYLAKVIRLVEKLLNNVVINENGCWIWTGREMNSGYGIIHIARQAWSAHRAAYRVFNGGIPTGVCVLHSCDVKRCINPAHLFLGTKQDNSKDMVSKGRHKCPARNRTHCPKGHPYSGINSNGARICHTCQCQATIAYYSRKPRSESFARPI